MQQQASQTRSPAAGWSHCKLCLDMPVNKSSLEQEVASLVCFTLQAGAIWGSCGMQLLGFRLRDAHAASCALTWLIAAGSSQFALQAGATWGSCGMPQQGSQTR